MQIKLKLSEVDALSRELNDLLNQNVKFSVKFDIRKNMSKLKPVLESLQTTHQELIKEYGVEDEEKKIFTLEGSEKAQDGLNELVVLYNKQETIKDLIPLKNEDFDKVTSEYPYDIVFKLIKK